MPPRVLAQPCGCSDTSNAEADLAEAWEGAE
jgi:hypothetical protein